MQFTTFAVALFAGIAAAQFNVCFDDFDCIGQGSCVKSGAIAIVGSCSGATASGAGFALPTAIPTSFTARDAEAEPEAEA